MTNPAFIITIDTEGDNLWQNYDGSITTDNVYFLPRFQALCEQYCFKPVYLTNYEMVMNDNFVNFARNAIKLGNAEIGMHLHAWNNPPIYNLTGNDMFNKPLLIEYPYAIMREKIFFITHLLEDTFQTKMLSHRAGRWAFNERYAEILIDLGYRVDCSVTPKIDWRCCSRSLSRPKSSNYRYFPDCAYFIDCNNISIPGTSNFLEVPVTTTYKHNGLVNIINIIYNKLRGKKYTPSVCWLRPSADNAEQMCQVAIKSLNSGSDYIEFMLHSSELMPGGSPAFKSKKSIESLYRDLQLLFSALKKRVTGMTLSQYYEFAWSKNKR